MSAGTVDVLIVDDDDDIRALLTLSLQFDGRFGAIYEAADADEGALFAGAHPEIGALVLDQHMPERCGLDVLPELRRLLPDATIVVYTCDDTVRTLALARGADDVASKTSPIPRLAATLARRRCRWLGYAPDSRAGMFVASCACGWRSAPLPSAGLAAAAMDVHLEA